MKSDLFITLIDGTAGARCKARSKRTGQQCLKFPMKGKTVCLAHGGRSAGPKTAEGRAKCAEAKTMHGREGRQTREVRAEKLRELRELERYIMRISPPL